MSPALAKIRVDEISSLLEAVEYIKEFGFVGTISVHLRASAAYILMAADERQ
jgi:hypothetical protein